MQTQQQKKVVFEDESGSEYVQEKVGNFERVVKKEKKDGTGPMLLALAAAAVLALFGSS